MQSSFSWTDANIDTIATDTNIRIQLYSFGKIFRSVCIHHAHPGHRFSLSSVSFKRQFIFLNSYHFGKAARTRCLPLVWQAQDSRTPQEESETATRQSLLSYCPPDVAQAWLKETENMRRCSRR